MANDIKRIILDLFKMKRNSFNHCMIMVNNSERASGYIDVFNSCMDSCEELIKNLNFTTKEEEK
jgi:hypothetical protein